MFKKMYIVKAQQVVAQKKKIALMQMKYIKIKKEKNSQEDTKNNFEENKFNN